MDQSKDLSKKLGRLKGVDKLLKEAKKTGINVSKAQVKDFVEGIGPKQLLMQSQPSLGTSTTSAIEKEGSRWQADLIQIRFSSQEPDSDEEENIKQQ